MLDRLSVSNFMRTLSRFRQVLGPRGRRWLLICFFSSLTLSVVEYALAAFIQVFLVSLGYFGRAQISGVLLPLASLSTVGLCALLVAIGAIRSLALFVSAHSNDITQEIVACRYKQVTLHEMLLRKGRRFLPASEVHYRISELYPKSQIFIHNGVLMLISLIQTFFLVAGMLYIAWRETLIGLAGFALTGLLVGEANRRLADNARLAPGIQAGFIKGVERVSRNWLFIRISRTQNKEAAGLFENIFNYYGVTMRISASNTLMLGMPPFCGICLFAVIIFFSRSVFLTKASVLVSVLFLFLRMVQYTGNASNNLAAVTKCWPQFREAIDLFVATDKEELDRALALDAENYRARLVGEPAAQAAGAAAPSAGGLPDIRLRGVSFAWAPDRPKVLDGLDWRVGAGEIAGIVGPSGSGKSTLLLLILGMLEPAEGSVEVGGAAPAAYFDRSGAALGYVGAEPFLIDGTLQDNLEYGLSRKPSPQEIREALEQARLSETVRALDRGLEYRLDENGSGLSTGQKQRLALARALLRRPKILILDEATANLDAATEAEIAGAIKRLAGRTTVLIVSHRTGILGAAERILKLGDAAPDGRPSAG